MIIKCPSCNREYQVDDNLHNIPFEGKCVCGTKFIYNGGIVYQKSDRTLYTLLALFFGCLGVHNFYSGRKEFVDGIIHIAISIPALVSGVDSGIGTFTIVVNCGFVIFEMIRGPVYL